MGLVSQWRAVEAALPEGWQRVEVRVTPSQPEQARRAAALLGPLQPGLAAGRIDLTVTRGGPTGAAAAARVLRRLDAEGIGASLETGAVETTAQTPVTTPVVAGSLAEAWDRLTVALPEGWSDLLCLLELRSTDDLAPAALAMSPLNPSRHDGTIGFRFRAARSFGYGAAPEMVRRCFERLDGAGIHGALRVLDVRAGTRPVLTQGPTFTVGGRAV